MLYVIYCEDHANTFELRRTVRPAHLARLEQLSQENRLLLAGPLLKTSSLNPNTEVDGSLIIAEFESKQDADAWAASDPYVTAGVYSKITIKPFKKVFPT